MSRAFGLSTNHFTRLVEQMCWKMRDLQTSAEVIILDTVELHTNMQTPCHVTQTTRAKVCADYYSINSKKYTMS